MGKSKQTRRKAITITLVIASIFAVIGWLSRGLPYDFEVVSVTQNPGENMRVKFKFTNHSDEVMKMGVIQNGIQSIAYLPAHQKRPTVQPMRGFAFSGFIQYDEKEVKPESFLVIEDQEGIRKSGETLVAMWQPPVPNGWFSNFRTKMSARLFGSYPIRVSGVPATTWREKIRAWIDPGPAKSLFSDPFVVP